MENNTEKYFILSYKNNMDDKDDEREKCTICAYSEMQAIEKFEMQNSVKIWLGFIVDVCIDDVFGVDEIPF